MSAKARADSDLAAALEALGSEGLGVEGVHVCAPGGTPLGRHWVADIRRDIFSASKTFTSVAVGIAQAEGHLEVDDTVLSHLGHLTSALSDGVETITIRHLLTMSRNRLPVGRRRCGSPGGRSR